MQKISQFLGLALVSLLLTACGTIGTAGLDASLVGQQAMVKEGLVLSTAIVAVKPQQNYATDALGGTTGGAIGAAIGTKIGNGRGNTLATMLGGLLGAAAGTTAMQSGHDKGMQYLLKVENQRMAVVMTSFDPSIRPGERVLLIYHGSRVTRIQRA
ncbi:hypothetical protein QU487_06990 [Crenobacter sp. SG2305]|uniref:hypothetical protein n=1 Tax=Crenobacter oryzisoli TaxID=3056844 RepID=UPI0025AAC065|nr:hypothetical protein [Crenobacter sp. SG2305]MDN0082501.1 hypothetical protein [Crenobacter sp. SG2305]